MPASVGRALDGAEAAVNLVGVLYETGRQRFMSLHAQGARNIAEAAAARKIATLVQVSAIGADADAESKYARTKALGELAARENVKGAVVLRPSVVFGQEDDLFNRFAKLALMSPVLPLPGGGATRFAPIYVGDLAAAIANAVTNPAAAGKTYELGGPAIYSFRELMELTLREIHKTRLLLPLPWPLAQAVGVLGDIQAATIPIAPPLTSDQVRLLRAGDNVPNPALPGLVELGVKPTALDAIVPTYLYRYRKGGQFAESPLVAAAPY
jgi:NADH dehydrogenase